MQTLYDIAQDYEAYLREHPESLLCKFLLCVKVQVGHTLPQDFRPVYGCAMDLYGCMYLNASAACVV
jgi:hypothetical protein